MPRTATEIKSLLQERPNRSSIQRAIRHEQRLRLHSEVSLERGDAAGVNRFLEWVEDLLPSEKYLVFLSLFQFPAFTNELTGDIFSQLGRVFSGRNRSFNYQFRDTKMRDDWEWYRQNKLGEPDVWETEAWEVMKTSINSVLVVDLPAERKAGLPEPYFYFLPIENVLGFESDGDEFEWVAFDQDDGRHIAFFDKERRAVFEQVDGKLILVHEKPHKLGYCPARFFWTDKLGRGEPHVKLSPLSRQLSKLDWLLFFEVSKHHLDLYAPYPIYSGYAQDCDFTDPENGAQCESGFLRTAEGYLFDGGRVAKCPICSNNKLAGVGSYIEVPQPDGNVDMRNPVTVTTIDRQSLDYNVEEVRRLKDEIFNNAAGRGVEQIREAMNESQVASGFETKTSVLNGLKKNFENAQLWTTETCCLERYGGTFLSASIDLGTEFYIYTVKDLYEKYAESKEAGASDSVLDGIMDKIIEVENLNNPVEMQRVYILKHLEPFRHLTKKEVVELWKDGLLTDPNEVLLKVDFSNLIQRFERENTNIIEFGVEIEFDKKIEIVKQKLIEYVRENHPDSGRSESRQGKPEENGQPKPEQKLETAN